MKTITKPWYVRIKTIASTADGMIYGLGSNGKVYVWHHSLEYRGKWVIHIRITDEEKVEDTGEVDKTITIERK